MATKTVNISSPDLLEFCDKLSEAGNGTFKKELIVFLDGIANEFLRILEDEIIRRKVVDTRLLLNSFHKGVPGNVWELREGGLVIEVGTSVEYASYVNDGHWTNPKGVATRWVPGHWNGSKFVYDPSAKTGMLLKQQWIEGAHYWDAALRIMEKMLPEILEKKVDAWLSAYFGM